MRRMLLPLVALALVAASCSGSDSALNGVASLDDGASVTESDSDEAVGESESEVDTEEAVLAFTACLRDEGLDVTDPEFDADGGFSFNLGEVFRGVRGEGPNDELRTAMDECRYLIEGVAQQFDRPDQTEIEDELLAFAACMRDNGVDMADPDLSGEGGPGGGAGGGVFGELDLDDDATEQAFEVCQSELAFGVPGGGPGGPGGAGRGAGGGS